MSQVLPFPPEDRTLRGADDLARAGLVAPERMAALARVAERYAVAITPDVAELIAADPDGPIARQFLPAEAELRTTPEERADPIGDDAHSPVPGIVHRYPDRVLLKPVHVCAVYCRFCFRREMVGPGKSKALSPAELDSALAYITARPEIWEVILTGGDPLVLSPRRLAEIGARLAEIDHVKVVRLHTRLPVVDPARITGPLIRALDIPGKTTWLAVHVNHADELTPPVRDALARLAKSGIPLVSQSVLLRGINDDAETLAALFRALVECRVKPYYLHHGDLAPGTSHVRASLAEGQGLMRALRGHVSGLCQPTYVLDIPGGHGKAPVGPEYLTEGAGGTVVEDWQGGLHAYPPCADNRLSDSHISTVAVCLPPRGDGGPEQSGGPDGGRATHVEVGGNTTPPIPNPSPRGGREAREGAARVIRECDSPAAESEP